MHKNQKGQGLIEYLIIIALMGVATLGLVRLLNHTVNVQMARVIDALQAKSSRKRFEMESVDEDMVRKKDLSDFMNGAASEKR